ncbi:hypothetical protein C8R47DRAFT_400449 [Mycena vitilis]|nr:hypothetical protein C8R47DRAFT_400449 [Mycena vitilis]
MRKRPLNSRPHYRSAYGSVAQPYRADCRQDEAYTLGVPFQSFVSPSSALSSAQGTTESTANLRHGRGYITMAPHSKIDTPHPPSSSSSLPTLAPRTRSRRHHSNLNLGPSRPLLAFVPPKSTAIELRRRCVRDRTQSFPAVPSRARLTDASTPGNREPTLRTALSARRIVSAEPRLHRGQSSGTLIVLVMTRMDTHLRLHRLLCLATIATVCIPLLASTRLYTCVPRHLIPERHLDFPTRPAICGDSMGVSTRAYGALDPATSLPARRSSCLASWPASSPLVSPPTPPLAGRVDPLVDGVYPPVLVPGHHVSKRASCAAWRRSASTWSYGPWRHSAAGARWPWI